MHVLTMMHLLGFNNLIELEFNITNAIQSDNSAFLTAVATLFLPISYLASLFGMTTVTWPAIWYLWAAIPVFVVSAAFNAIFPWAKRRVQAALYPLEERRLRLRPNQFTMLGDELPENVNAPGSGSSAGGAGDGNRPGRFKHRRTATGGAVNGGGKDRSVSRMRSISKRRGEKDY